MTVITPSQVHVNKPLTDFALAYQNDDFIADLVSPRIYVDKTRNDFYKQLRKDIITPRDDRLGDFQAVNAVSYEAVLDSYKARDRGLRRMTAHRTFIDKDTMAPGPGAEFDVEWLVEIMNLNREIRIADTLDTNTNYAVPNRFVASAAWSDYTNSDPVDDLLTALRSLPGPRTSDRYITRVIIEETLWDTVSQHPKVSKLLSANAEGLVAPAQLATYLRVDEILVPRNEKNVAQPPLTPSVERIWDTDKVRIVRVPRETITATDSGDASGEQFLALSRMAFIGTFTVRYGRIPAPWIEQGTFETKDVHTIVQHVHKPDIGGGAGTLELITKRCEGDKILQNDMGAIITGC